MADIDTLLDNLSRGRAKRPEPGDPAHRRSRASNKGILHLGDVDGRSTVARRWKDLVLALHRMLGDDTTEPQRQLVRRAASLCVLLEGLEEKLGQGEAIDPGRYGLLVGQLRRLLRDLGFTGNAPAAREAGSYPSQRLYEITGLPHLHPDRLQAGSTLTERPAYDDGELGEDEDAEDEEDELDDEDSEEDA